MSIIGKALTVGGGGSSSADAVLQVLAPTGSTVTISNGSVSKTLKPSDGHAVSMRGTVAQYIFSIRATEFGTFSVTGTKNGETGTTTVTISDNSKYDAVVWYHAPLLTYQEVEYIEATGTQSLNVNISIPVGYSTEAVLEATEVSSESPAVHYGTSTTVKNRGNIGVSEDGYYTAWFNNIVQNLLPVGSGKVRVVFKTLSSGPVATMTDENGNEATATYAFTSYSFDKVFLCQNGNATQHGKYKIYSFQVNNGTSNVREMYPCVRLSDSVAGMYDKANDVFYTNAGTGTFVVGPDV